MTLTLIRGCPGSGKSTYAKKHYSCLILENDMFQTVNGRYFWSPSGIKKAILLVQDIAEAALESGADVCVANTFVTKKSMDFFLKLAKRTGAKLEVIRMDKHFENVHDVPAETLASMKARFEDFPGEKTVA